MQYNMRSVSNPRLVIKVRVVEYPPIVPPQVIDAPPLLIVGYAEIAQALICPKSMILFFTIDFERLHCV